jgi:hypothetical protein
MAVSARNVPFLLCVVCTFFGCTKSTTSPTVVQPPSDQKKVIARVLGKEIFEEDLVPTTGNGDQAQTMTDFELGEYRQRVLQTLIWRPLMDKYCLEHDLQPTNEEIELYKNTMGNVLSESFWDDYLRTLHDSLEADNLTESEKHDATELISLFEGESIESRDTRYVRFLSSKLESTQLTAEERRTYTETLAMFEAEQKLPEAEMKFWKFNRALYAEYGGVVIFQQSNPFEPVGAHREWLEHHEEVGDFEILDPDARAQFWDYYQRDWESTPWVVHDPDPLGQPWWLKIPTDESESRDESNGGS